MIRKVAFVELPVFSGVAPLASAYMEAMCRKDKTLPQDMQFQKVSFAVSTADAEVLRALLESNADLFAFSCYVWNSGKVRRLLADLMEKTPNSYFVLGGPQVMHQANDYVPSGANKVFVCNGEGERTFAHLLAELLSPYPHIETVRGISFCRDGQIITTDPEPRINDLSEIPSPFLEGVLEKGRYSWILFETNRGCPFRCNYCYWGSGATGAKVYKYDDNRLRRELEWISQSHCSYLFIADANWGMLKRDVELSQYIVECREKYGAPVWVTYCGSKNTPERVSEIAHIFHEGRILSSQSVSMQTMNAETLRRVQRENIKTSAYVQVQESLNRHGISSFVELIWPLPGETLQSFQEGLARLCELGADSFLVYPLLLFNNVELAAKRVEYGLVTVRDPDPDSEAEIVVETREVNREALRDGLRYLYAVTCLYVLRGLSCLARHLHTNNIVSYAALFREFVDFCWRQPDNPWTAFCDESIRSFDVAKWTGTGALIHFVLHSHRETFDDLLGRFVTAQPFGDDPVCRFLFEVDLLGRPYIYSNTPVLYKRHNFSELRVTKVLPMGYEVEVPERASATLKKYIRIDGDAKTAHSFVVNCVRSQLQFAPRRPLTEHFLHCHDSLQRMREIVPVWRAVEHRDSADMILSSQITTRN